jgi:predicted phage terminase large subunit-like protein
MAEFRFRQEFLAEFVSPGIGFFKRGNWEYVDVLPRGLAAIARGWDFASTKVDEKKKNDPDWTAGALVARGHDDRWYIADVRRMRGTPKERRDFIRSTAEADGRGVQIGIPQDPGSAGIDVSDEYVIEVLPGFRVVVRRETGSKILRAEPLAAQAQAKNVSLLRGPWVPEWLNESDMFPNGIHDDQVDATSLAFSILSAGVGGLVAAPGYGPIQNQTEKRDLAGFVPERAENPFRSAREPGAWGDEGRRR